jgi:DNA-damage-inducible protein D
MRKASSNHPGGPETGVMKAEIVRSLTASFEAHAQQTESGVEFWLARDVQHLLGYAEWRNFSSTVISKAKTACDVSGHAALDHFVGVNKMVDLGSGRIEKLPRIRQARLHGETFRRLV